MRRATTIAAAIILLGFGSLAAACGGSSSKGSSGSRPSKAGGSSSTTTTTAGGVDPNAPEVVAPGDIPDTQVFVPFTAPGGGYSLKVPEGWARELVGTTTTFTDHYNSATAAMTTNPTVPTAASVQATEVPTLQRDVPSFRVGKVETVNRTAGPAVRITYRAASAPDPVTGKRVAIDVERYEFWRNGKQVTLTLSGARGSDNVDPWKTITNSFAWTQ